MALEADYFDWDEAVAGEGPCLDTASAILVARKAITEAQAAAADWSLIAEKNVGMWLVYPAPKDNGELCAMIHEQTGAVLMGGYSWGTINEEI